MGNIKDIRGRRFGRLRVKLFAGVFHRKAYWCCECKCVPTCHDCQGEGCVKKIEGSRLITGGTRSCGCSRTDPEAKSNAALRIPKAKRIERSRRAHEALAQKQRTPAYKLSLDCAAELIGCSRDRVVSLCDAEILRSVWRGGQRKVSAVDVKDYISLQCGNSKRCDLADPAT